MLPALNWFLSRTGTIWYNDGLLPCTKANLFLPSNSFVYPIECEWAANSDHNCWSSLQCHYERVCIGLEQVWCREHQIGSCPILVLCVVSFAYYHVLRPIRLKRYPWITLWWIRVKICVKHLQIFVIMSIFWAVIGSFLQHHNEWVPVWNRSDTECRTGSCPVLEFYCI